MRHSSPLSSTLGRSLLAVLVSGLLALSASAEDTRPKDMPYESASDFPSLSPDYQMTSHKVVLITNNAVNPRLVNLEEGQLVAWISYAPSPSVGDFEREVARSMICHILDNYSLKDDELRSAPINAGEFASFCQLKPGRYRYKILRPDPPPKGRDAAHILNGEIIVGDPS